MKTFLRALAVAAAAFALAGCPETHVGPDFGYGPLALKPSEWNGNWKAFNEEDTFVFRVSDAKNGRITITVVPGPKAKKSVAGKPIIMTIRAAGGNKGDALFFVTLADQGDTSREFTPSLLHRLDNRSFALWGVNNDAVAAAIKAGKLKGKVKSTKDGAHSFLESAPSNYRALAQPRFWTWMNPTLVGRCGK